MNFMVVFLSPTIKFRLLSRKWKQVQDSASRALARGASSIFLFFLLSQNSFAQTFRDIKPPVDYPVNYFFLILAIGLLILCAVAAGIFYFLKRRKEAPPQLVLPPEPAHLIAYAALDALRRKKLLEHSRIKEWYFELSLIVRYYLENRFSFRAPEMTSEEFLYSLKVSGDFSWAHKDLLEEFMNHCDLVKFAKYGPSPQEIEESFLAAKRLVDETKFEQNSEILSA